MTDKKEETKVKHPELAVLKQGLFELRNRSKPAATEEELSLEKAEAEYYTDIFESAEKDK